MTGLHFGTASGLHPISAPARRSRSEGGAPPERLPREAPRERKRAKRFAEALLAGAAFLTVAHPVYGVPIPVPNFSFENPDLPDLTINTAASNWLSSDGFSSSGVFNPNSQTYPGATGPDPAGTLPAPADSLQHGFMNTFNLGDSKSFTTASDLASVAANTTYLLTVALGNRLGFGQGADPGDYRISLLVNGSEIAFTTLVGTTISNGSFQNLSTSFATAPSGDPLVGGALRVRLSESNPHGLFVTTGDFDNVRLDATLIPEPSTLLLVTFGLALAAGMRRRRAGRD